MKTHDVNHRIETVGLFPTRNSPWIMGVLNCTPDSFSDGGQFQSLDTALTHAHAMIDAGVDMIDVGGESTRPGSESITSNEQIRRTVPVIEAIRKTWDGPISVDTTQSAVAEAAMEVGANWINDISALRDDPQMVSLAAGTGAGLILMHMQGAPRTMQESPQYRDVLLEVSEFLSERAAYAQSQGVAPEHIVIDPGIGFGKTFEHNLTLLRQLDAMTDLGYVLLVGASRKSFIGQITGAEAGDRVDGSVATAIWSILHGAQIVRVHDVTATRRALDVVSAIWDSSP